MSRKIIWPILLVLLLVVFCTQTFAAETDQPQRRTGTDRRRGFERMRQFDKLLDDMGTAYENKDYDKVGQLIEQMKQNSEQMRQRAEQFARRRSDSRPDEDTQQRRDRRQEQSRSESSDRNTPMVVTASEEKIIQILEDMNKNQSRGMMNVPPEDGRLLRLLTETTGAKKVVEIGTSNGYSGIWFCLALRKTGGSLVTHEINAERASLARENFKRAGVEGIVTLVEGDAHKEVSNLKGPIDIVFVDADKEGYMDYLNKLLPLVRPGGLIIAHNTTNAGPQMQNYLKAVTTSPELETLFLHEQGRGVGVTMKKR